MRAARLTSNGFSLIEVICALGIFAGGILVVMAFFPLMAKSGERSGLSSAATAVADQVAAELRRRPWSEVISEVQSAADLLVGDLNPVEDARRFYSTLDGRTIAKASDSVWSEVTMKRQFEISLVRDEDLSPLANDPSAAWLVFEIRVRWPIELIQDHASSEQGVRWFHGSIRR